jgi:hypothetical protein
MKYISVIPYYGNGDEFDIDEILYEDDDVLVANVVNDGYDGPLKIMARKATGVVYHHELSNYVLKVSRD